MINVLMVVNGWPSGGCIEQAYLVCKYLPKDRFKFYNIGFTHFDGAFFKKMEDIGVTCIKSDREYTDFKEVIDKYKIDIVHSQTGGGDYEPYVKQIKELGIPLVHQLHCPRACAIPADEVDTILYTTPYTYDKNSDEHKSKMKSIQYSIDLKEPIRKEPHIKSVTDGVIKVGRLGRIVPDKRPDVILNLARMCMEAYGKGVEFHIAGMIPQDFQGHIDYGKAWVEEARKIPNVKYHGFVDDKYDFWKTIDICINPVWETSFDIVFLEAMACGIPILTWDNSAAPYVVEDSGLVCPESNANLFCGLNYLLSSPEIRRSMGEKGIDYIKTKYALSLFIEEYIKVYEKIMEKK